MEDAPRWPMRTMGPYRIGPLLGSGATAAVYQAWDAAGQPRALKLLHAEHRGDLQLLARFYNERLVAAQVQHPGLCRVLDAGEHQGSPFLVLERLGPPLAARRLAPAAAAAALGPVAAALAALHRAGVVHRDLSPRNLLYQEDTPAPRLKVCDLGLAKVTPGLTRVPVSTALTAVLGSADYRAPESWLSSKDVDPAADVYALGVLLYEQLAGALPFHAARESQLMELVLYQPPPPLPGADAALAALVQRMLAKRRGQRPTMEEVAAFLQEGR